MLIPREKGKDGGGEEGRGLRMMNDGWMDHRHTTSTTPSHCRLRIEQSIRRDVVALTLTFAYMHEPLDD